MFLFNVHWLICYPYDLKASDTSSYSISGEKMDSPILAADYGMSELTDLHEFMDETVVSDTQKWKRWMSLFRTYLLDKEMIELAQACEKDGP